MMPKPARNTTIRTTQSDKNRIATFSEARSAGAQADSPSGSGINISAAIRRRPFLAAAPILLAILLGVPYALKTARNEYHAEASIYVSPTFFKNLQADKEQLQVPYSTLVNQQILTIRRSDILSAAIKRLELQGVNWRTPGETETAAVARMMASLQVRPIPDSYEVLIGLNGNNKDSLAVIVNTVADTYLEKERSEELTDRSNRFSTLTAARAKIETTLQQRLEQQSQVSAVLKVANLDKAPAVEDTLLAGARQALEDARRKRLEAETQVQIMTAAAGNGKSALTSSAEETVANDPNVRTFSNYLLQRIVDLRTRIEGLTPEHPLRQSTEREIGGLNSQLSSIPNGPVTDVSARMLAKLRADVDRARLLEAELDKQVQSGTLSVRSVAKQVQQAQGLTEEIERLRKSFGSVSTAIELAFQESAPGSLRVFSAAQTPLGPSKTSLERTLGIILAVALLFSVGLCVFLDLIDQRIFSPADVKRAVGFTPVGLLLENNSQTEAFSEEQFWRLVNGIQRAIAVQDAKSIIFTPLRFARNPPTLVADIAHALTSCGLKTTVLDAKPRRGDERSTSGLIEIPGHGETGTAIVPNSVSSVATLEVSSSTRELTRVPAVGREIVDKMKRDYDVVLIDAPSLLLSADMEYLAVISDITLMVVETGEATRRELIQGANMLRRIGTPSIGVVMSQVRMRRAGAELKHEFKRFTKRHAVDPTIEMDANSGGI